MKEKKTTAAVGLPKRHTRSDAEMAFLYEKYHEEHPDTDGPVDPGDITDWAIARGLYRHRPISPRDALRRRMARHLGQRYMIDKQGREVRALHALKYEEQTPDGPKEGVRYYPLFTTEPDIIKATFQYRRGWALNRVVQIEKDRQSYNDNNTVGGVIEQTSFDFDTELEELSQSSHYPEGPADDEDDEDDR